MFKKKQKTLEYYIENITLEYHIAEYIRFNYQKKKKNKKKKKTQYYFKERKALVNLQDDPTIIIKEADNVGPCNYEYNFLQRKNGNVSKRFFVYK